MVEDARGCGGAKFGDVAFHRLEENVQQVRVGGQDDVVGGELLE